MQHATQIVYHAAHHPRRIATRTPHAAQFSTSSIASITTLLLKGQRTRCHHQNVFKQDISFSVCLLLDDFLALDSLGTDNHTRPTGPVVSIDRSGATKVVQKRHSLKLLCLLRKSLFWL